MIGKLLIVILVVLVVVVIVWGSDLLNEVEEWCQQLESQEGQEECLSVLKPFALFFAEARPRK
jgi:hypothetical protein